MDIVTMYNIAQKLSKTASGDSRELKNHLCISEGLKKLN
jgi:hypothetical protein